jgi:hypothetical protein
MAQDPRYILSNRTTIAPSVIGSTNDGSVLTPTIDIDSGNPIAAALEVNSTTGAFVPPRMTTEQRLALFPICDGMIVYDTNISGLMLVQSGLWTSVGEQLNIFGTVSAAQLANLIKSPQTVVEALPPIPGLTYVILSVYFQISIGNTAITQIASIQSGAQRPFNNVSAMYLQYDNIQLTATTPSLTLATPQILFQAAYGTAQAITDFVVPGGVVTGSSENVVGKGLYLGCSFTATGGNNTTIKYSINYNTLKGG